MKHETFLCQDIPAMKVVFARTMVKDGLLRDAGDGRGFLESASRHIHKEIFNGYPYKHISEENALLKQLLDRGYKTQQIADALADAWLHERGEFYLPRIALIDKFGRTKAAVLLSMLLTWITMYFAYLLGRHFDPETTSYVLWFGPLTGFLSLLVGGCYFWLLHKWVKAFSV